MCVEKREERHEKRDTHVCGSVRVSTGTEIYLAHTLTQIVLGSHLVVIKLRYVYGFIVRATNGLNAQATRGAVSSKCPVSCGSAKTK